MKWYKLYKESSDSDFEIKNGILKKYHGKGGNIIIPNDVTSIGRYAFYHCDGLKKVTIPGSVKIINEDAFYYCKGLEQVTLLDGVEEIKDSAFRWCSELTKVTIPDSIKWIGRWAFLESRKLAKVTLPKGVRYGTEAFSDKTSITIKGEKPPKVKEETVFGIQGLTIKRKDSYWGNPEYLSFKGGKEFHIRDLAGMISHHTIMRPLNDDWSGRGDYSMLCRAEQANPELFKQTLTKLLEGKKIDSWWDDTKGKWETDEKTLKKKNKDREEWQRNADMMNGL